MSRLGDLIVEHDGAYVTGQPRLIECVSTADLNALRDELIELRAKASEATELRALFELQWTRSREADARWRAEDPEARANVWPDLGVLLKWLMDQADAATPSAAPSATETGQRGSALGQAGTEAHGGAEGPMAVHRISYPVPLAEGTCNHGQAVRFNLAFSEAAIWHGDGEPCDGHVLTYAQAADWRAVEGRP